MLKKPNPTNEQPQPTYPARQTTHKTQRKTKKPYNLVFMSRELIVPMLSSVIHSALTRLITQCLVY